MVLLTRIIIFLAFSFTTSQEILSSQNGKCSSTNLDLTSLPGLNVKVKQMYEHNDKHQSDIMSAHLDIEVALKDLEERVNEQKSKCARTDERCKTQQFKHQNDSVRYEEELQDLRQTVHEHSSKLITIDERNERQRSENQNASVRFELMLQDLRETVDEHNRKILFIEDKNANWLSNYQNVSVQNERALQDLSETVREHDLKFMLVDKRNQKLQSDFNNGSHLYDNAMQDLRQLIQDLHSKLLNLTDVTDILRQDFRFFMEPKGNILEKDDTSFLVSKEKLSWTQAWAFCRKRGSILVHIQDSNVNNFLLKSLSKHSDDFWIGGEMVSGSYKWKTTTGYEPITWSNWAPGEPNRSNQKCIQLWKGRGHRWDNDTCTLLKRFVCSRRKNS